MLDTIGAEQAKAILSNLGTGESTPMALDCLVVRGFAREFVKVGVVLDVIDSAQPYIVRAMVPASTVRMLPSNDQIAQAVGRIAVGA